MFCAQVVGGFQGGQRVQVHDAVDAVVILLQGDIILDGTQVIAQVLAPGGAGAGKNAAFLGHALPFRSEFADQILHLPRAGEAAVGKLGVDQTAIDGHLEAAAIGGQQGEGFQAGFEILEELGCQTGSLIGIRSDRAVLDGDLHLGLPPEVLPELYPMAGDPFVCIACRSCHKYRFAGKMIS